MKVKHNFLPRQYEQTGRLVINHSYLVEQFSDYPKIFKEIEKLVQKGDFTLGSSVDDFEKQICALTGSKFCVGVGSGTDALFLSLKAAGIEKGDEVITTPYTFFATVGAIVTAGAKPVFVDIREDFNIDTEQIKSAITPRTKAILPVHWSGLSCEMEAIMEIAEEHGLFVVEDACHGIQAEYKGKPAGTFGLTGCFSMHPLKNLNVWGDGGYLITNDESMYERLVLMRNHGLINREECSMFAYNSRLDSLQAIVANHLLCKIDRITESRIAHAARFDAFLAEIPQIQVNPRPSHCKQVYHIYVVRAERRDKLQNYLVSQGIDAKVHYPIPMHLQPAAKDFGYVRGDFPVAEATCESVISFPVHEFISDDQIDYVCDQVRKFYDQS